jgi:hypothetical protein
MLQTVTLFYIHCGLLERFLKFHTGAQLYGLPHGIIHDFNTILYENEFQNPQIFQQTISLFPEQSTLHNSNDT